MPPPHPPEFRRRARPFVTSAQEGQEENRGEQGRPTKHREAHLDSSVEHRWGYPTEYEYVLETRTGDPGEICGKTANPIVEWTRVQSTEVENLP